jgi:arabinogalactan oligomer/maltooligosaccharide transport system permease protein
MALRALIFKLLGLGLLNALSVYVILTLAAGAYWIPLLLVAGATAVLDWIYFGKRRVPAKYLAPGVFMLVTFNIFILLFTIFLAFTNFGAGHNFTKAYAVETLSASGVEPIPGATRYDLTVLDKAGSLAFLVTDPEGKVFFGDAATPLRPAPEAEVDAEGKGVALSGYAPLKFAEILQRQDEVLAVEVPVSTDSLDGVIKTADGRSAKAFRSVVVYDEERDVVVNNSTGMEYRDEGRGVFVSSTGDEVQPGWAVLVGLDNFRTIASELATGRLLGVLIWNFAYAIIAVFLCFALGIFLALVFNDSRMRSRRMYRVLLIVPYAFPAFLSVLVWGGLLNPKFGFVNQVLLFGNYVPWLLDPWLAKLSVLIVTLWFGYPYAFLVATGALQAVPKELEDASIIDGANKWQLFRAIRLPILLVALSPLLVISFAVSFNDFNTVWLLTRGGPIDATSDIGLGATDILITVVYKIAFVNGDRNYGLASAFAAFNFAIIACVAIWSFRRTKRHEEIMQ